MLLAIDIGNTNVKTAIFYDNKIQKIKRFKNTISIESIVDSLIDINISYIIISSVVPEKTDQLTKLINKNFKIDPFIVSYDNIPRLKLNVENPETVGADRICNIIGGLSMFNSPMIIIDFGTATTYDVIDKNAVFKGGAIAPGVDISANYLYKKAALLRSTTLKFPEYVIGKNTEANLQSGIMFGVLDSVQGMIGRIKSELELNDINIILTGGFSKIISKNLLIKHEIIPELTFKGILNIYNNLLNV